MIVCKINVTRIDKTALFDGKNGKYLDIALVEKPDQYGNDGFVAQGLNQERRAKGEKGPIIGSWKTVGGGKKPAQKTTAPTPDDAEDDMPF